VRSGFASGIAQNKDIEGKAALRSAAFADRRLFLAIRSGRCRGFRLVQRLGAFLAADLDSLATELDGDGLRAEFAVAGSACGLLHLVILLLAVPGSGQAYKIIEDRIAAVEIFSDR
jgi:hypothetical protein